MTVKKLTLAALALSGAAAFADEMPPFTAQALGDSLRTQEEQVIKLRESSLFAEATALGESRLAADFTVCQTIETRYEDNAGVVLDSRTSALGCFPWKYAREARHEIERTQARSWPQDTVAVEDARLSDHNTGTVTLAFRRTVADAGPARQDTRCAYHIRLDGGDYEIARKECRYTTVYAVTSP